MGKLANTVIIFISDNGHFAGHHRISSGKLSYYEESIRVPFMMRGPGIPANTIRSQLVSNIDLAPTILDLADTPASWATDGKSLLPLIQDASTPWRTAVFVDGFVRVDSDNPPKFNAVRTPRYLYVEHEIASNDKEFYDLQLDPFQLQNKASDPAYADVRSNLQTKLDTLKTCAGVSCWITGADLAP